MPDGKNPFWQILTILLVPLIFGAYIFSYHFTWSLVGAMREDVTTIALGAKTDVVKQLEAINARLSSIEEHLRKQGREN